VSRSGTPSTAREATSLIRTAGELVALAVVIACGLFVAWLWRVKRRGGASERLAADLPEFPTLFDPQDSIEREFPDLDVRCPLCGQRTVLGRSGEVWYCSRTPHCTGAQSITGSERAQIARRQERYRDRYKDENF
jgi:hypothetical protein